MISQYLKHKPECAVIKHTFIKRPIRGFHRSRNGKIQTRKAARAQKRMLRNLMFTVNVLMKVMSEIEKNRMPLPASPKSEGG